MEPLRPSVDWRRFLAVAAIDLTEPQSTIWAGARQSGKLYRKFIYLVGIVVAEVCATIIFFLHLLQT